MKNPSSRSSAQTRFIPREEIQAVERWQFGAVSNEALERKRAPDTESADAAEAQLLALVQARDEGRAQGYAQAASELKQQMDDFYQRQGHATAERLALCAQAFEARWDAAEQALAQGVLELACALARQVVRRELVVDPQALTPVIRESLGMLAADARAIVVRLHPADFGLLESALRESFAGETLLFRPDATVPAGGCLVESGGMTVDGTLEKRWSRAVASLGLTLPWVEEAASA